MNSSSTEKAKEQLVGHVKKTLEARLSTDEFPLVSRFVDIFWRQLPLTDWQDKDASDIAGCCYSLWSVFSSQSELPQIKILNPDLTVHGWLLSGTAIMVRQRDMPFLVDSLRLELNSMGLGIRMLKSTLINVVRGESGELLDFVGDDCATDGADKKPWLQEALIYIEIGLTVDADQISEIQDSLKQVLGDVATVVNDHPAMLKVMDTVERNLQKAPDSEAAVETQEFLQWLRREHFTFLGIREYTFVNEHDEKVLVEKGDKRLGLFRALTEEPEQRAFKDFGEGAKIFYQGSDLIAFSKSGARTRVHRSVYPDYIVIKLYSDEGEVVGETRILGLFTYSVYSMSPQAIPIIRNKVQTVVRRSGLTPTSHDGRNLLRVLETLPRDELFQADLDTLFDTAVGVANISERRVVRLFSRPDLFGKFVNCIVYVPRDIYNTQVRLKIEQLIGSAFNSRELDSTTYFSESLLARAYIVFRLPEGTELDFDRDALEESVVDITRGWQDRLEVALVDTLGEAEGLKYFREYGNTFSSSYQENFDARVAVQDIQMLEGLAGERDIAMNFFRPIGAQEDRMRFKVVHLHDEIELSDVIPILEHLGMRVLGELPFKVQRADGATAWLHNFSLKFSLPVNLDVQAVNKLFEQAFAAVWQGEAESDAFNRLVLGARLNWREVVMLRAYGAYMKQTNFTFSQDYIADTLASQLEITRNLVALFKASFDPRVNDRQDKASARIERLKEKILHGLESVENLNEDRILRRYFELINGTLRTNFYQKDDEGLDKEYLSIKFSPRNITDIPEPKPMFEIFVYSPRVEGVHLRGSSVARGGVRWSDRLQDYRTEVLGLMKAQQVKNSVIVPSGAKGGFIAKQSAQLGSREAIQAEAVACYKMYMQGLLDITDNYIDNKLVEPENVIAQDDPDPYLVVAADKGTSSFSDIANGISQSYDFWLGDAFASGGSQGYDHKKMGITARGGWISVKRHFQEKGIDIQQQDFSVVGIGDMGGDVFGNGMLLSRHIRLLGAFNHLHIFVDPDPDPEKSYKERQRLFTLERSTWLDYQSDLISRGGGVFLRSAKSIEITPEMQACFAIEQSQLTPNELISALLKSPVDLLWNGGIGTYVKGTSESHADVGDKGNDAVRVNGTDLRCRVIGEGGNLGMTQLGRIEYAFGGGACNTDFIDNSAGVDCSDHEVNIKILLNEAVAAGDLTSKQRNQLLMDMTDDVAELVLANNYRQTLALSLAEFQAVTRVVEHRRFISFLEGTGRLDRALEFLPGDEQIIERIAKNQALTRPELAILLSYAKAMLKDEFIEQEVAENAYLQRRVEGAFPAVLVEKFEHAVYDHPLMKEIVATQVANDFINTMGVTSAHRLLASSNASFKEIAIAFSAARDVFQFDKFRVYLGSLDNKVDAKFQLDLMASMARRIRRGTRWFLRNRRSGLDPAEEVPVIGAALVDLQAIVGGTLGGAAKEKWDTRCAELQEQGVAQTWLLPLAMPDNLFSGLSVVEIAKKTELDLKEVALVFFALYERLNLGWFATQLTEVQVDSYWQAMAREAFLDDLDAQLRRLVIALMQSHSVRDLEQVNQWFERKEYLITRWLAMVGEVESSQKHDFAMYSVAIRELIDLAQASSFESPLDDEATVV